MKSSVGNALPLHRAGHLQHHSQLVFHCGGDSFQISHMDQPVCSIIRVGEESLIGFGSSSPLVERSLSFLVPGEHQDDEEEEAAVLANTLRVVHRLMTESSLFSL
ncbi:hypothetical protein J4Q44_G00356190, partial [Coregonus suidteri]